MMNKGIHNRLSGVLALSFAITVMMGVAEEDIPKKKTIYMKVKSPKNKRKELPTPPTGKNWKLVWQDEFEGQEIDSEKWNVAGDHVRKDGFWWKKNCYLDGKGELIIKTTKEPEGYAAGAIKTRGKFEKKFGLFVVRCRITGCVGHGPAFWLTTSSVGKTEDQGRDGTEIDIMEKFKRGDTIQHALHWDGYGEEHKSRACVVTMSDVAEGYHTFALYWTEDEYIFYVDGIETWRTRDGGVSQVPEYIILSDEIRKWNGDISKEKLPHYFIVDYVRIYDAAEIPE